MTRERFTSPCSRRGSPGSLFLTSAERYIFFVLCWEFWALPFICFSSPFLKRGNAYFYLSIYSEFSILVFLWELSAAYFPAEFRGVCLCNKLSFHQYRLPCKARVFYQAGVSRGRQDVFAQSSLINSLKLEFYQRASWLFGFHLPITRQRLRTWLVGPAGMWEEGVNRKMMMIKRKYMWEARDEELGWPGGTVRGGSK